MPRSLARSLPHLLPLLALACLPALPQAAPPAATGGTHCIAGIVVNTVTNEPVSRATLALLAQKDSETVATAESDTDGRFALCQLPASKFKLTASKRGFRTAFYDEHGEFSTAIVTGPGQDTSHLAFRLSPNAVLRGVVTADGGDPVEGARVNLFLVPPEHGRSPALGRAPSQRITQVDSATTDDTGAYEFSSLSAGKYLLAVMAEPWYALHQSASQTGRRAGRSSTLDVAYSTTFYDSTTEEASATPIALLPGGHEEADIALHAVPALHLVVDTPVKQDGSFARPELMQTIFGIEFPASTAAATSDPAHSVAAEFTGVAPGRYELEHGDPPRIVALDASVSRRVDPAEGAPAVSISGTLRSVTGSALPDELSVALSPIDGSSRQNQVVTTAQRGQFRFDKVLPGRWELSTSGAGQSLPVVSITSNGAPRTGNVLIVRDRSLSIAAVIAQGETRIDGHAVKDGKSASGAMVVLLPKSAEGSAGLIRRDQADSDGSFTLHDVAPGQYTVVAIEAGWELDLTQPAVVARFLPKGVAVTVTESSGKLLRLPDPVPVQAR